MKKGNFLILGMLAMVPALGLVFIGCDSGGGDPILSEVSLVTEDDTSVGNWDHKDTFSTTDRLAFHYRYEGYYDFAHVVWTVRQGTEVVIQKNTPIHPDAVDRYDNFKDFTFGPWFEEDPFPVGSYTFEVYAVDVKRNTSNTVTKSFTVR